MVLIDSRGPGPRASPRLQGIHMRMKTALITLGLLVGGWRHPVGAHHSVPVNFDQSKEITIEGVLTEIKWMNPHSRFRVNVVGADGKKVEWLVEMGASNTMKRAGFPMDRFMVGDRVAITGNPGRRDRAVLLREAVMPNGDHLNPDMRPAARDATP
jgi:hypothetical protein